MTTTTTLKPVTREIRLYGKNGKAQGPTKAYPHAQVIIQEGELVKDFGDISVWKFPPNPNDKVEDYHYWISYHNRDGNTGGGGAACKTEEEAIKRVERTYVFREYNGKKRELYQEHRESLARLEDEYKGRI